MTSRIRALKGSHYPVEFGDHRHCGSGYIISQDHVIKGSYNFHYCPPLPPPHLTLTHHLAKFCYHRNYNSGDIMASVVEEEDSTCSLTSAVAIFSKPYDISYPHRQNLRT